MKWWYDDAWCLMGHKKWNQIYSFQFDYSDCFWMTVDNIQNSWTGYVCVSFCTPVFFPVAFLTFRNSRFKASEAKKTCYHHNGKLLIEFYRFLSYNHSFFLHALTFSILFFANIDCFSQIEESNIDSFYCCLQIDQKWGTDREWETEGEKRRRKKTNQIPL